MPIDTIPSGGALGWAQVGPGSEEGQVVPTKTVTSLSPGAVPAALANLFGNLSKKPLVFFWMSLSPWDFK